MEPLNENAHHHKCPNCGMEYADSELLKANARIMDLQQRICSTNEECPVCGSENTEWLYFGLEHPHNRYACRNCGWAQKKGGEP